MKHTKSKPEAAVILTIRDAAKMTAKGRRSIAAWLDRQKKFFLNYPATMSRRYTARYLINPDRNWEKRNCFH